MKNLIRSEFYRLFKDKGIIVTCILALAFSILGPLLITIGVAFLESTFPGETFSVYAIDQFYPLLGGGSIISIILFFSIVSYSCNDFKFGTIRNKVISGYERSHIFLSKLIVIVSTGVIVQFVYSILSLLFYSLFLGFNETNTFTGADFVNILQSLLCFIVTQITIYTLITLLSITYQKNNKTVLFFLLVSIAESSLFSAINVLLIRFDLIELMDFFNDIFVSNQLTLISMNLLHTDLIILMVVTNIIYTSLLILIGLKSFSKKELK